MKLPRSLFRLSFSLREKRKDEVECTIITNDVQSDSCQSRSDVPPLELKLNSVDLNERIKAHRSSQTNFQHESLNISDDSTQIRLLRICPGDEHDPLECILEHATIYRQYCCLSYEWGLAEAQERPIIINEKLFWIRENLWNFLQTARRYGFTESIWIDAICIKQNDVDEKNHQVKLMGVIYGRARMVIVWLGLSDAQTDNLVKFQAVMRKNKTLMSHFTKWKNKHAVPILTRRLQLDKAVKDHDIFPEERNDRWLPFTRVLDYIEHSTYWSRAWIVQEVLQSRRLCLLSPGPYIDLGAMFASVPCGHLELLLPRTRKEYRTGLLLRFSGDKIIEKNLDTWFTDYYGLDISLLRLLRLTRDRECLLPIDKIFSVLHLWDCNHNISIDYKIPALNLLQEVLQVTQNSLKYVNNPDRLGLLAGYITELLEIRPDVYVRSRLDESLINQHYGIEQYPRPFWVKSRCFSFASQQSIPTKTSAEKNYVLGVTPVEKDHTNRLADPTLGTQPTTVALCVPILWQASQKILLEIPMVELAARKCYTSSPWLSENVEYGLFHECQPGRWGRLITHSEIVLSRGIAEGETTCECDFLIY